MSEEIEALKTQVRALVKENKELVKTQLDDVAKYESALAQADECFRSMPSRADIEEYYKRRALC